MGSKTSFMRFRKYTIHSYKPTHREIGNVFRSCDLWRLIDANSGENNPWNDAVKQLKGFLEKVWARHLYLDLRAHLVFAFVVGQKFPEKANDKSLHILRTGKETQATQIDLNDDDDHGLELVLINCAPDDNTNSTQSHNLLRHIFVEVSIAATVTKQVDEYFNEHFKQQIDDEECALTRLQFLPRTNQQEDLPAGWEKNKTEFGIERNSPKFTKTKTTFKHTDSQTNQKKTASSSRHKEKWRHRAFRWLFSRKGDANKYDGQEQYKSQYTYDTSKTPSRIEVTDKQAYAIAKYVGSEVFEVQSAHSNTHVHLFVSAPIFLVVMLGRCGDQFGDRITFYELDKKAKKYFPIALNP